MDLWAFDDLEPEADFATEEAPKPDRSSIPASKESGEAGGVVEDGTPLAEIPKAAKVVAERVTVNASQKHKAERTIRSSRDSTTHSTPGSDFDDLDGWDEAVPEMMPPSAFKQMTPAVEPVPAGEPVTGESEFSPVMQPEDDRDEFSPKSRADVQQGSLRPKLNLSGSERLGMIILIALLAISGGIFYFFTINRLPTNSPGVGEDDFPIRGETVEVVSAVTYWREPVTTGENPDTVRRDTLLIPVADLSVRGGPAAIRIFFRDSSGELAGDAVSRTIRGDETFQVAATVGFEDLGKHDAYRTGDEKVWTIEILEAPSETSPAEDFKRLFEMNISTDRR